MNFEFLEMKILGTETPLPHHHLVYCWNGPQAKGKKFIKNCCTSLSLRQMFTLSFADVLMFVGSFSFLVPLEIQTISFFKREILKIIWAKPYFTVEKLNLKS